MAPQLFKSLNGVMDPGYPSGIVRIIPDTHPVGATRNSAPSRIFRDDGHIINPSNGSFVVPPQDDGGFHSYVQSLSFPRSLPSAPIGGRESIHDIAESQVLSRTQNQTWTPNILPGLFVSSLILTPLGLCEILLPAEFCSYHP